MTRVNALMTGNVVTIDAEASGHDAVELMVRKRIRHLPVVDGGGLLCGIVTDRDLRHRLFGADVFRSIGTVPVERLLSEIRVRDVMSAPAISVGLDTELEEAASVMAQKKLGSLPVSDRGRIVGMSPRPICSATSSVPMPAAPMSRPSWCRTHDDPGGRVRTLSAPGGTTCALTRAWRRRWPRCHQWSPVRASSSPTSTATRAGSISAARSR